jgi:ACS family 4-hydroxyphenylacetate permease-like MFS transporter
VFTAGGLAMKQIDEAGQAALRKAFRRLVPCVVILYVIAYIDRINIGFAALSMNQDLGLTAAMFGFANTIFYIGYSFLEVPSNMLLARFGPRLWLARIMISWGIASAATMFVVGPHSLYGVRFLVGAAEAGALPGVLFYLANWFPSSHRGRANAFFLAALPIALLIGSPLSGLVLQMNGLWGLSGWRWLFLLEGLMAVICGFLVYLVLPNRPADAKWLSESERQDLQRQIDLERAALPPAQSTMLPSVWSAIGNRQVIALGLVYFCIVGTVNTLGIWTPLLIKEMLHDTNRVMLIGFLGSIPALVALVSMLFFSAHSDKVGERNRYCAYLMGAAAIGWMIIVFGSNPAVQMLGLCICYMGAFAAMPVLWTAAGNLLPQGTRAVGIAAVSMIGTFASILSPSIVGVLRDMTHTMAAGAWYSTALLVAGMSALLTVPRQMKMVKEVEP